MVIWLIGLSGSGKTTIGQLVAARLRGIARGVVFLDGDIVREIFGGDLSHTLDDRRRNAERICRLCQYLEGQGVVVVCGILSIFHESQEWNRANYRQYFEVYVDAPLDLVRTRDARGVYSGAGGKNSPVVGVDIPFPPPLSPNLVVTNNFTRPPTDITDEIFAALPALVRERGEA